MWLHQRDFSSITHYRPVMHPYYTTKKYYCKRRTHPPPQSSRPIWKPWTAWVIVARKKSHKEYVRLFGWLRAASSASSFMFARCDAMVRIVLPKRIFSCSSRWWAFALRPYRFFVDLAKMQNIRNTRTNREPARAILGRTHLLHHR